MSLLRILAFASFLAACGGAPARPATVDTRAGEQKAAPPAPDAPSASAALIRFVPRDATFAGRLDAKALRGTALYRGLMAWLSASGFSVSLDELDGRCGFSLAEALDEVVLARTDKNSALLVATTPHDSSEIFKCASGFAALEHTTIAGAPAIGDEKDVALVKDGLLFAGDRKMVEEALAVAPSAKPRGRVAEKLAGLGRDVFSGVSVLPEPRVGMISGSLAIDDARLLLAGEVEFANEADAASAAAEARAAIASAAKQVERVPGVREYLDAIQIAANGNKVDARFELLGGAEAQAKLVGMLSALGVYSTRRYLLHAKASEALNTVGAISRALAAYIEREDLDAKGRVVRHTKFPPSAPLTPKDVPRGVKYATDASTWSHPTWQAIRFAIVMPVYYSYQIETSKDGKTAIVRAHGDLNGDGKQSTFERVLTLDASGAVKMGDMKIEDELE